VIAMAEADHHARPEAPVNHHLAHVASHPRSHSEAEAAAGIVPSHGISIKLPDDSHPSSRPLPVKHMSAPTTPSPYKSPIRHHQRQPSKSKEVKETLNARSHYGSSDDDGASVHRINQYIIKQEIGRGSFGAVHLACDQYGGEYAVKEFSKSRLRKRAQSNLLRKPNQQRRPGHLAAGLGFNSPLHRLSSSDKLNAENNNSLSLIKEEIAIMKKLNHNNLVNLIEVLDDPQEDSLYMVLEMCKKGVVMKVGLDERAEPYSEEACRCWFRDMILGIEYLHAQGIIHRDIKPDNCLITDDDVLKIVDFGVSEMFEKNEEMATAKSAGSPAFMPPELCVARHGQVSGRAADIWSMGVTLYCLKYGHIPFEKGGMLELYDAIREEQVPLHEETDETFKDLMRRILEKDPDKRITMEEIRVSMPT
jgi:calcium/calmodulin-dependent protein kinase kinase 2